MNGGAVRVDMSPEKDVMLYHPMLADMYTTAQYAETLDLEKGRPAAFGGCWNVSVFLGHDWRRGMKVGV